MENVNDITVPDIVKLFSIDIWRYIWKLMRPDVQRRTSGTCKYFRKYYHENIPNVPFLDEILLPSEFIRKVQVHHPIKNIMAVIRENPRSLQNYTGVQNSIVSWIDEAHHYRSSDEGKFLSHYKRWKWKWNLLSIEVCFERIDVCIAYSSNPILPAWMVTNIKVCYETPLSNNYSFANYNIRNNSPPRYFSDPNKNYISGKKMRNLPDGLAKNVYANLRLFMLQCGNMTDLRNYMNPYCDHVARLITMEVPKYYLLPGKPRIICEYCFKKLPAPAA